MASPPAVDICGNLFCLGSAVAAGAARELTAECARRWQQPRRRSFGAGGNARPDRHGHRRSLFRDETGTGTSHVVSRAKASMLICGVLWREIAGQRAMSCDVVYAGPHRGRGVACLVRGQLSHRSHEGTVSDAPSVDACADVRRKRRNAMNLRDAMPSSPARRSSMNGTTGDEDDGSWHTRSGPSAIRNGKVDANGQLQRCDRPAEGGNPLPASPHSSRQAKKTGVVVYLAVLYTNHYAETGPIFLHRDACERYEDCDCRRGLRICRSSHCARLQTARLDCLQDGQRGSGRISMPPVAEPYSPATTWPMCIRQSSTASQCRVNGRRRTGRRSRVEVTSRDTADFPQAERSSAAAF